MFSVVRKRLCRAIRALKILKEHFGTPTSEYEDNSASLPHLMKKPSMPYRKLKVKH